MATKENRLIDQMPAAQDPKEMRVLVLGLARTATKCMDDFFQKAFLVPSIRLTIEII
jgi:hypothetical protein